MIYDQAVEEAKRLAAHYQENIYIADCKVYVDEFDEGNFIVGSKEIFAIMYANYKKYGGKVVDVVDTNGNTFCNDLTLT